MAAGSKGVTTRGGGGSRSRGRSTVGRGGRSSGGGGRSSAGGGGISSGGGGGRGKSKVGAGKSSKGGALRIPGVEGSLPASDPRENTPVGRGKGSAKGPDGRGKFPAKVVGGKVGPSRSGGGANGGETSAGGGTPMGGRKSTHRVSSSHDSNPVGQLSPPSQGTPHSVSSSQTNMVPLQYPTASQGPANQQRLSLNLNIQPQRLQVHNPVEEDEVDEDEDEVEGDDIEDDDMEEDEVEGDEIEADEVEAGGEAADGEDEDYQQLLENLLAHPGRQALPFLSVHPIPERKTLW